MLLRTVVTLALVLQTRTEWVEISQQHYRKPTRPLHHAEHQERPTTALLETITKPSRTYLNDTSANPHWSRGNVIRVVAGVGRVEHVTKPGAPRKKETARPDHKPGQRLNEATDHDNTLEKPERKSTRRTESVTTEKSREKAKRKSTSMPEDYGTARPSNRPSHATSRPPERATDKISLVRRTNSQTTRKPILGESDEDVTEGPRPKYGSSRPEGTTESNGRRKYNSMKPKKQASALTRRPTIFASTFNPDRSTRVPNRIYINDNKASSSRIPSDDEFFVTEKPTSTTKSATKSAITINRRTDSYVTRNPFRNTSPNINRPTDDSHEYFVTEKPPASTESDKELPVTINRRMDTYVTRNPYGNLVFLKQRPSEVKGNEHQFVQATRLPNNFRKPAEYSTSEPTPDPDEVSLDSQDLDIRRIDIASIVDPDIPDFITKQNFSDDVKDDESKHLYIDYEETVSDIPAATNQRNPFSIVENEEMSSEATIKNGSVQNEETLHLDDEDDPVNDGTTHENDDKFDDHIEEKKPNPIENVVKFMKVVSDTISKNTRRSITSKVRYLEDLRDTIMTNIGHRIDETWPEDPAPGRSTREARGHVDFPSSEGALMSISFLTFAVFLIKLIMQVIYKYKNQTMMLTPTVISVSRAADALMGRPGT